MVKKTVEFKDLIFEEQALSVRNKDNLLIEVYIKKGGNKMKKSIISF